MNEEKIKELLKKIVMNQNSIKEALLDHEHSKDDKVMLPGYFMGDHEKYKYLDEWDIEGIFKKPKKTKK